MIMLFEDNKEMPCSRLLRLYYGSNVDFADGNNNLHSRVEFWVPKGEMVLCYIDYANDNIKAMSIYGMLHTSYRNNSNVILIKIPCIEYFVYLMLNKLKINRVFNRSTDIIEYICGNIDKLPEDDYEEPSLEKYIKQLTEVSNNCITAKNRRKDGKNFYVQDCPCDFQYCKAISFPIKLDTKILVLLDQLPIFYVNGKIQQLADAGLYTIARFNGFNDSYYEMCKRVKEVSIRHYKRMCGGLYETVK